MHRLMTECVTLNTLSDHNWFFYLDTILCCISVNFESFGKYFFRPREANRIYDKGSDG